MQFRFQIRLHPAAVELAWCLETSCLSDACGLIRHVLKTSSETLHHLRPSRTVDTKSIEYRRERLLESRLVCCVAGLASKFKPEGLVHPLPVVITTGQKENEFKSAEGLHSNELMGILDARAK